MRRRWPLLAFAAGVCLLSACVGAVSALLAAPTSSLTQSSDPQWTWYLSYPGRSVGFGRPAAAGNGFGSGSDLAVNVTNESSLRGQRIVLSGLDGNLELEHGSASRTSILTATSTGTSARRGVPVAIGAADGRDVVPLVVAGAAPAPPQTWSVGGRTVASVSAHGGLEIGGATLVALLGKNGRVTIDAVLPDGKRQLLLVGRNRSR